MRFETNLQNEAVCHDLSYTEGSSRMSFIDDVNYFTLNIDLNSNVVTLVFVFCSKNTFGIIFLLSMLPSKVKYSNNKQTIIINTLKCSSKTGIRYN